MSTSIVTIRNIFTQMTSLSLDIIIYIKINDKFLIFQPLKLINILKIILKGLKTLELMSLIPNIL